MEFLSAVGLTLALLVVGRTLLSLLPPGAAGSHRASELPLTLALSAVLGFVGVLVPMLWLERCGVRSTWPLAAFWTIVPLLRFWLRPHGFVPRRAWFERESWASKTALFAVFAAVSWPIASALIEARELDNALARSAGLAALAAITLHGLQQARRAPLARRLVVLLLLMTPVLQRNIELRGLAAVVAAAMGVSFLVAWLRRGDERAAALSAIGFAILAVFSNVAWVVGILALVIATHPNARRRVLMASVIAIVAIGGAIRGVGDRPKGFELLDDPSMAPSDATALSETSLIQAVVHWQLWGFIWIALGLAIAALVFGVRGGRRAMTPERPGRELVTVAAVLITTLALTAIARRIDLEFVGELHDFDIARTLALLLPAAALTVGLVLAPSENSLETR